MNTLFQIKASLFPYPLTEQIKIGTGVTNRSHVGTAIAQSNHCVGVTQQIWNVPRHVRARNVNERVAIVGQEVVIQPLLLISAFSFGEIRNTQVRPGQVLNRLGKHVHVLKVVTHYLDKNVRIFISFAKDPRLSIRISQGRELFIPEQRVQRLKTGPIIERAHRGGVPHHNAHRPGQDLTTNIQPFSLGSLNPVEMFAPKVGGLLNVEQSECALSSGFGTGVSQNTEFVFGVFPVSNKLKNVPLLA